MVEQAPAPMELFGPSVSLKYEEGIDVASADIAMREALSQAGGVMHMNQHRNSVSASYKRTQGVRSLYRIHWSSVCCPKTVKEAEYVQTTHGNQGEAAVEVGPVDLQRELSHMTSLWK